MCRFANSQEAKRCKKLQLISLLAPLLEKAAPKPLSTDPSAHQNKAAYQTAKYFYLSKRYDGKKCVTDPKKLFLLKNFTLF